MIRRIRSTLVPVFAGTLVAFALSTPSAAQEYRNAFELLRTPVDAAIQDLESRPDPTRREKRVLKKLRRARRVVQKRLDASTPKIAESKRREKGDAGTSPFVLAKHLSAVEDLFGLIPDGDDDVLASKNGIHALVMISQLLTQQANEAAQSGADEQKKQKEEEEEEESSGKRSLARLDRVDVLLRKGRALLDDADADERSLDAFGSSEPPKETVAHELAHVIQQRARAAKVVAKAVRRLGISDTLAERVADRVQTEAVFEGAFFGNLLWTWSPTTGPSDPRVPTQFLAPKEGPAFRPASHLGVAVERSPTHVTRTLRFAFLDDAALERAVEVAFTWPSSADPLSQSGGPLTPESVLVDVLGPHSRPETAERLGSDAVTVIALALANGRFTGTVEIPRPGNHLPAIVVDFDILPPTFDTE